MSETEGRQPPQPTDHHKLMKPFEGDFQAEVKFWFGEGDPMISTGTIQNTFHLDGLYLHQDYVADPIPGPHQPFAGKGYWGYNTATNQYEGFWIDNASTIMQLERGNVDESGKIWEMHSEIQTPGGLIKKRSIFKLIDNDNHKMEAFFGGPDGTETKQCEISYTRK